MQRRGKGNDSFRVVFLENGRIEHYLTENWEIVRPVSDNPRVLEEIRGNKEEILDQIELDSYDEGI